jgi:hypothetical protein
MTIFDDIPKPTAIVPATSPAQPFSVHRKEPPDDAKAEIRALSATGFSMRGIAAHFGTTYDTLTRWLDEYDELQEAFKIGRDQERYALHNALYLKAMNGDGPAAMFLLKSRHGYREGDQSDQANRVAITFNLPGATKAEDYGKVTIDGNDSAK